MSGAAPRVAVICDRLSVTTLICEAAIAGGCDILVTLITDSRLPVVAPSYSPDVWIVDLSKDFDDERVMDCVCTALGDAVLFDDHGEILADSQRSGQWLSRMLGKVERVVVAEQLPLIETAIAQQVILEKFGPKGEQAWASNVWILGASLGGPDAVVAFLRQLPENLPVGFIYAQHIEAASTEILLEVIRRNTAMKVKLLHHGMVLGNGEVGIVPVNDVCRVLSRGRITVSPGSWDGAYAPCIDQLMDDVAHNYGNSGGAIVFSGMGVDGALGGVQIKAYGGSLWVQSPESCVSSIMPQAVRDTGMVDKEADPEHLAKALVDRYTGFAA
jgi:chemosensory pili system protein ChpB (putative protein-glutamate methylesterase)